MSRQTRPMRGSRRGRKGGASPPDSRRRPVVVFRHTVDAVAVLVLLLAGKNPSRFGRASTVSGSSNSFSDIRNLDWYGNAVQVRHAGEACHSQGRLVVAMAFLDSVVVATPVVCARAAPDDVDAATTYTVAPPDANSEGHGTSETDKLGGYPNPLHLLPQRSKLLFGTSCIKRMTFVPAAASSEGAYLPVLPPLLTIISRPEARRQDSQRQLDREKEMGRGDEEPGPSPPLLAAAWSGLSSDAAWVRIELARAAQDAFEQYGTRSSTGDDEANRERWQLLTVTSALHALQSLYRRFWNYRAPGRGKGNGSWDWRTNSGAESEDGGWARPIGVTTMIVQAGIRHQHRSRPIQSEEDNPQIEALSDGNITESRPDHFLSSKIYVVEPSGIVRFPAPIAVAANPSTNAASSIDVSTPTTMSKGETPASALEPTSMAVACIGKRSDEVQRKIEQLWKNGEKGGISDDEPPARRPSAVGDIPQWLARVLGEVLGTEGGDVGKKSTIQETVYLQVEIVSSRGVDRRVVSVIPSTLRAGNGMMTTAAT